MFNIISFSSENIVPKNFGYEKLYELTKVKGKIVSVKTTTESEQYKGKKLLVIVENYEYDEGSIRVVADKKKACYLIDLSKIINSYGTRRAVEIAKLRSFLKVCNRFGAFYAFADFSRDEFELRRASELKHISLLLGINEGQAKFALGMLNEYLE
ncbi:MAG: hypothetical protein Q7S22_03650 [Candidatus Micrarchaeota archaeon]|nr:hypothetical protein [Candidatus Micrarchaeota archaeon]